MTVSREERERVIQGEWWDAGWSSEKGSLWRFDARAAGKKPKGKWVVVPACEWDEAVALLREYDALFLGYTDSTEFGQLIEDLNAGRERTPFDADRHAEAQKQMGLFRLRLRAFLASQEGNER